MLEILSDASGMLVAGAILFAAAELRRISDALRDLDSRVSSLESHWLHAERLRERPGGTTDDTESAKIRGRDRSS